MTMLRVVSVRLPPGPSTSTVHGVVMRAEMAAWLEGHLDDPHLELLVELVQVSVDDLLELDLRRNALHLH